MCKYSSVLKVNIVHKIAVKLNKNEPYIHLQVGQAVFITKTQGNMFHQCYFIITTLFT